MIRFEEASKIVIDSAVQVDAETVALTESLGRILARDVVSDMDMPPFDKSAVDGYACRREDLKEELEIIEVVPAGKMPEKRVSAGKCIKIMTGAPVPEGADVVIMVEDVEETGTDLIRYAKNGVKDNICLTGEDIRKDKLVLTAGTRIEPQHIAVLATVGCANPKVYRKIRVGIVSTGDELVEPSEKPKPSQIRNSNAYQLMAQVQKMSADPVYIGIALDTEESTRAMITKAFRACDVVLLTGGVSMGDFDYVPAVLKELNVSLKFKSIAVQPGRPTVFGVQDQKYIFGLPGNPVSSFVQFELLVKPLLYKMAGHDFRPPTLVLPMAKEHRRKKSVRMSWKPVRITEKGTVEPLEYHGSAHINALTLADGLIALPIGKTFLEKGELVDVRQI
jgi:molybdopterin molybdotransferase